MKWETLFLVDLRKSAAKAGVSLEGLKYERATLDQTWGDKCGFVFYGASPEVNERAAKFFEAWARKNLRKLNAVGGYNTQESIGFIGVYYFARYSNGAEGWHRFSPSKPEIPVAGSVQTIASCGPSLPAWELRCEEVRLGYATSYVYYPGAD